MHRPIYICLEGLDGSGKSTAFKSVVKILEYQGYTVQEVCPTQSSCHCENKARCHCHSIEKLFNHYPILHKSRFLRMFLYAYRSNYAAQNINNQVDIILGDRSIVTSYVCRWNQSTFYNRILVWLTDKLEHKIPAPDYIIYLDVPQKILQARLSSRLKKDIDETKERSRAMQKAYYIISTQLVIKRLVHTKWHVINGDQTKDKVVQDILDLILPIITKKEMKRRIIK